MAFREGRREQNGDPRYLNIAWRVAEREDRLWMPQAGAARATGEEAAGLSRRRKGMRARQLSEDDKGGSPEARAAASRFPYLPAGLCDLECLACGLRGATDGAAASASTDTFSNDGATNGLSAAGQGGGAAPVRPARNGTESVPYREPPRESENPTTPVARLFEQRCAEAFRCLGFEVRELGQVADCLAVAAAERFAVIIDAKVRRRGYIVEVEALLRLVNDSICKRREFRLADVDQLLFGNKILAG